MCGICGIVSFDAPVEAEEVEAMGESLYHRGPDEGGQCILPHAGLGFRRLSIIDVEGSHQPLANEDRSIWMVFNGEIYNFRQLRLDLEKAGHRFQTRGDGEVIVHLYEDEGLDFVRHLNGMFAIALWDAPSRRLILARDRLGIKPLSYAHQGTRLAFASETKALLQLPWIDQSLDMNALADYMNYSAVPGPRTGFREIRRLAPGHLGIFQQGRFAEQQYWNVDYRAKKPWKERDLLAAMDETLHNAVRIRMISDVPLGVFLSGGVDSSLIAAMMTEYTTSRVEAFSVGFGRDGEYMNEIKYARAVAQRYGMEHHQLILSPDDLLEHLDRAVWYLDEPCGDPSAVLTLALSDFTRRHVKVALSGLGGDELFAGYRRHLATRYQSLYLGLPRILRNGLIRPLAHLLPEGRGNQLLNSIRIGRRFLDTVDEDPKRSWARSTSFLPPYQGPIFGDALAGINRDTFINDSFESHWAAVADLPDEVDKVMYVDSKMYMVDARLLLQDKMSMGVSLEARVPFLDHRMVELAASVPVNMKLRRGTLKAPLKKLAETYVPKHCIYREKKGFTFPLDAWLRGPLRPRIDEALSPETIKKRGIFAPEFISWLQRDYYQRRRDRTMEMFQVFLLELWMQIFVDGRRPSGLAKAPPSSGAA